MRTDLYAKTIFTLAVLVLASPVAFGGIVTFQLSGIINNYGNPNTPTIPALGFSPIPIPLGTPFSLNATFDGPLPVGISPGVTGALGATVGNLNILMINPFVGITVNHGVGPFPSGFDTIEFDPFAPAITSGDSVGNWQVVGLNVVFYGDTGTVGISSAGLTGPLDPTRFTDIKEFSVFYRNPLSGKEAAIDSINGSLVPTLWPGFTPIPEPSSMILMVPIVIVGFLKIRSEGSLLPCG